MDVVTRSLLQTQTSTIERNAEYAKRWAFYKGEMYTGDSGQQYAKDNRLFKHMREVFNCVTQTVDTDARFVMKKDLAFMCDDDRHTDTLKGIWEFSNIQSHKYKLVKFGGNLGDCYIEVRELSEKPYARLIVLNSEDMTVNCSPHDQEQIDSAVQSYTFWDAQTKRFKNWDRVWYPDRIETYIDHKIVEELSAPHNFGEVPIVHIKHLDIGETYGLHTWHPIQHQVDAVNELGSYIMEILYRYADPTMIATGPVKPSKIIKGNGNIFYMGSEGDMRMLEYSGNVLPNAIEFISRIKDDIYDTLPELSLGKIREIGQLSGYAVGLYMADFLAKVDEIRGNYANGLEWANALALKVANKSKLSIAEFNSHILYENALPEDELARWQNYQTKLTLGVESKRGIMENEGMTKKEIDAKLAEIREELEDMTGMGYFSRLDQELESIETPLTFDIEV